MSSVSISEIDNYKEIIEKDIDQALSLIHPIFKDIEHTNPMRSLLIAYYKYRSCFDVSLELTNKKTILEIFIKDKHDYEIVSKGHNKDTKECQWREKCRNKEHYHRHKFIHYNPEVYEKINAFEKSIEELELCNKIFTLRHKMGENMYIKKRETAKAFTDLVIKIYKSDELTEQDFYSIFFQLQIFERTFKNRPGSAILEEYYFYNPIYAILMAFILNVDEYLRENTDKKKLFSSMFGYMDQTGVSGTYSIDKIHRYFPDVYMNFEEKIRPELHKDRNMYNSPIIGVNTMYVFFERKEVEQISKRHRPNAGRRKTRKLWSKARNFVFSKNKKIKSERNSRKKKNKFGKQGKVGKKTNRLSVCPKLTYGWRKTYKK